MTPHLPLHPVDAETSVNMLGMTNGPILRKDGITKEWGWGWVGRRGDIYHSHPFWDFGLCHQLALSDKVSNHMWKGKCKREVGLYGGKEISL